jgi:hypothetical protein
MVSMLAATPKLDRLQVLGSPVSAMFIPYTTLCRQHAVSDYDEIMTLDEIARQNYRARSWTERSNP